MDLLIRTLLIWLLVLAIPTQGVAAATMAFCGPIPHGGATAMPADHAAAAGHEHVHGGLEATVSRDHPRTDIPALAGDEHGVPAKAQVGSADHHKCNVCGSCCSTGALISPVPTLSAVDAACASFSSLLATVDPFAADGPYRPPRKLFV